MKVLSSCLAIIILMGVSTTSRAEGVWRIGENRISKGGFETDEVGQPSWEWALRKDG